MTLATTRLKSFARVVTTLAPVLFTALWCAPAYAAEPTLPIVFVHGGAGSAAQYETQAMRFSSNGYPNVVTAIDRTSSSSATLNPQLDAFFDAVMAQTGDTQIYAVAHSLGTGLMNNYLNSAPERAARIAKYISIDGAPANCASIPTVCTNITAAPLGQGHTQSVTSPESFALQYAFFTGQAPATTLVLPEDPDEVEISGRLILFPANVGVDGATVELWAVDGSTGHRTGTSPEAVFNLGPDGAFGPAPVNGQRHYEFATSNPASELAGHYYYQPFIRSDHLIRLLSSPPDSPILTNTATGPDHSAAVLIRYKEWWADQGAGSDVMSVTTTSPAWDDDPINPSPPTLNILQNPAVGPRSGNKIGMHVHDAGSDKVSTLDPIPFFLAQFFQTGVDIWMPATEPPDGTISFVNAPRGDTTKLQRVNVANWTSEDDRIVVQFNDYAQDVCLGQVPTIVGTIDDDVLVGTNGPDVILARSGNDRIVGLGGDDVICAEDGSDTVLGGQGNDTIDGGNDDDEISGGNGNDVIDGRDGDDVLEGDNGDDVLHGGDGDDEIDGGNGRDAIDGDDGDDTLVGDEGIDTMDGGAGADRLHGGNGNDSMAGGDGDDTLNGNSGADTIGGGEGADSLNGGPGSDSLDGGTGTDSCDGGPQPDGAVMCEVLANLP